MHPRPVPGNPVPSGMHHGAAIESTPSLQGGFIRELRGRGILQRVSEGRPAGRAGAGLHGNGVAGPGRHGAYEGDVGGAVPDGPFVPAGMVRPEPPPARGTLSEHRASTPPVRIRCHRHEGVVVANHQHLRGLGWLTGTWELTLADGRTLTGPARLPDLRPGETAAVPLPFPVPRDSGEAWLALRVTVARDQPWAPRGTEVCVPRIRLRGPAPAADTTTVTACHVLPGARRTNGRAPW